MRTLKFLLKDHIFLASLGYCVFVVSMCVAMFGYFAHPLFISGMCITSLLMVGAIFRRFFSIQMDIYVYEILLPCLNNDGALISEGSHNNWEKRITEITKDKCFIIKPSYVTGVWQNIKWSTIPIKIFVSPKHIDAIMIMTCKYYNKSAIMYYEISNNVKVCKSDRL